MKLLCFLLAILPALLCAPAQNENDLESRFRSLQEQLSVLQNQIAQREKQPQQTYAQYEQRVPEYEEIMEQGIAYGNQQHPRHVSFQPMKRFVHVQPMKRSYEKEQVIKAVEGRLIEVIHAGEKLGVSSDEILAHLKLRNAMPE